MGCRSSVLEATEPRPKPTPKRKRKPAQDEVAESQLKQMTVEHHPPGYPPVSPPKERKKELLLGIDFQNIDTYAKAAPKNKAASYNELVGYLTAEASNDLEKLRAIFVWMGSQNISTAKITGTGTNDSKTPRGYMKLMQTKQGTFADFFALLCRAAKIPCVIVVGIAKNVAYEVGMADDAVRNIPKSSWNAVYVAGGWRLVFPLWAFSGLAGFSQGNLIKLEAKGKAVRQKETASQGQTVSTIDDYFFLTDPEEFNFIALPDEPKWQLLKKPMSFVRFAELPRCRPEYHIHGIKVKSKFSGRITTEDGKCKIELEVPKDLEYYLTYELYLNHVESGKDVILLQLKNFVFVERKQSLWSFTTRFPESGIYKFQVIGGSSKNSDYDIEICSFKVFCDAANEGSKPLPVNPRIGYGPSSDSVKSGIKAVSHKSGFVVLHQKRKVNFSFDIIKDIDVKSQLVSNLKTTESLQKWVSQTVDKNRLKVAVKVPDDDEYALQVFTKAKNTAEEYENACNYLLGYEDPSKIQRKRKEDTYEIMTRQRLHDMTEHGSIEELDNAIERFEELQLEDMGDLTRAKEVREFKWIKYELRNAIIRRHLNTLEKAITLAKDPKFVSDEQVAVLINKAEEVRDHLLKLGRFAHEVLAMDNKTILEIKSYDKPKSVIYDTMLATFLMLGDKKDRLKSWENIQILITVSKQPSLLRRVKDFDTVNVQKDTTERVRKILDGHTENEARIASAGAGTFYVWLTKVLGSL